MDPITLAIVTAIAAAAVTKPTEKIVGKLGEGVTAAGRNLMGVLRSRSPETANRLEAASESAGDNDPDIIDVEIIEEVKRVAADDPAVQAAVKETVAAVQAEQTSLQQLTKLADKIGVVNLGTVEKQTNNISI